MQLAAPQTVAYRESTKVPQIAAQKLQSDHLLSAAQSTQGAHAKSLSIRYNTVKKDAQCDL